MCSLSSALDGLRRDTESYTDQQYFSHFVHQWSEDGGRVRLARFRAVPADGRSETGRLTPDEHTKVWNYLLVANLVTAFFFSLSVPEFFTQ